MLINLDLPKAFNSVDHQFLAAVLETAGFESEFRKWISILYHNLQAVVQVNGKRSKAFVIESSVQQGCPLSPLLYVLALKPLFRKLRDERVHLALRGVSLTGSVRVKIFVYADDITVYVSSRLDILAVKKAVERYKKVAGAKVNFYKSKGL